MSDTIKTEVHEDDIDAMSRKAVYQAFIDIHANEKITITDEGEKEITKAMGEYIRKNTTLDLEKFAWRFEYDPMKLMREATATVFGDNLTWK